MSWILFIYRDSEVESEDYADLEWDDSNFLPISFHVETEKEIDYVADTLIKHVDDPDSILATDAIEISDETTYTKRDILRIAKDAGLRIKKPT